MTLFLAAVVLGVVVVVTAVMLTRAYMTGGPDGGRDPGLDRDQRAALYRKRRMEKKRAREQR